MNDLDPCNEEPAVLSSERFFLNEYGTNRAYGGPEEGGWWYDTGSFVKCHGTFDTVEEARLALSALQPYLTTLREGLDVPGTVTGKFPIRFIPGSVTNHDYPDARIERHPGRDFPIERPHYC